MDYKFDLSNPVFKVLDDIKLTAKVLNVSATEIHKVSRALNKLNGTEIISSWQINQCLTTTKDRFKGVRFETLLLIAHALKNIQKQLKMDDKTIASAISGLRAVRDAQVKAEEEQF